MNRLRFRWGAALLAVGLLFLLGGCSRSASGPGQETPSDGQPSQGEKKRGGVLRLVGSDPGSPFGLPWEIVSTGLLPVIPVFESLLWVDWKGQVHPKLAERWEADPDSAAVTLHLRRGVKFHDGTEMDAEAVRYNLQKQIENRRLPGVESVEVLDSHTVRIHLAKWDHTIFQVLGGTSALIASPTAIEQNGVEWARNNPVGTGPFRMVSFQRDRGATYERFDDYWDEGKPYLDGIETPYIADPQTAKAAFLNGDLDVLSVNDPLTYAELKQAGYPSVQGMSGITMYALMPSSANQDSPLADRRVREAISYALDRKALAQAQGGGIVSPLYQFAMTESPAYLADRGDIPHNPDRARQLLGEAGYGDGFSTKLILASPQDQNLGVAVQGMLQAVGIRAEVEQPEYTRFIEYRTKGWEGMLVDRLGTFAYYSSFIQWYFSDQAQARFISMKRPQGLAELLARSFSEPRENVDLVRQLHQLVLDDLQAIPLTWRPSVVVFQPYVRDTHHLEGYSWPWWTPGEAWLDK